MCSAIGFFFAESNSSPEGGSCRCCTSKQRNETHRLPNTKRDFTSIESGPARAGRSGAEPTSTSPSNSTTLQRKEGKRCAPPPAAPLHLESPRHAHVRASSPDPCTLSGLREAAAGRAGPGTGQASGERTYAVPARRQSAAHAPASWAPWVAVAARQDQIIRSMRVSY
jgi:hypothetical protein